MADPVSVIAIRVVPDTHEPQILCQDCGRRWGTLTTDRFLTGASSWTDGVCPACVWTRDCDGAA